MEPIIKLTTLAVRFLVACICVSLLWKTSFLNAQPSPSWNPKAATDYLDRRASWWMAWPGAKRDHGTFCVSCHTAVPYALARPFLRAAMGEKAPSENERSLLENVAKRVRLWNQVEPFYTESGEGNKTIQSRGTESVLNALILASADARKGKLSDDTRTAFDHMWAQQYQSGDQEGAWPWLDFGNEPFEANDSPYYGASLAAVAVGMAPENYRAIPEIQHNLKLLGDYLRREGPRQPLIHQVVSLW